MWVDKEVFGLLKEESRHQREVNESLRTKLDTLEAHHREQEDAQAQDVAMIARLEVEKSALSLQVQQLLQAAQAAKAPKPLPAPLPAWAKDVDWERVEGGPQQV